MSKAYITAPYTSKSSFKTPQVYGKIIIDTAYRNFLETIEATVKSCGLETFLPHKDLHKWGDICVDPKEMGKKSLEVVTSSDVIVAYPERSVGVNIELGWASLLKKKIILLVNERDDVSLMHAGLNGVTNSEIIKFRDIVDLKAKLRECLLNLNESSFKQ
jgi:deoxyadenosine/deoxycytidine kinase